jgi:hypothetical protein
MSWIIEAPNNNPSVFVLISSTMFQIDGTGVRLGLPAGRTVKAGAADTCRVR